MIYKVKLAFSPLSIPEKIQKAHYIITCLQKQELFSVKDAGLADIDELTNALHKAYQDATDGSVTQREIMRDREARLNERMTLLAGFVQNASQGEKEAILASGMEVASMSRASQDMTQPKAMQSDTSKVSGQIMLKWEKVSGARSYLVEKSHDGTNDWLPAGVSTKTKITIDGLPAVSVVWFRTCAVGPNGNSPWSDPVRALVG